jgi:pyridoxal phosphate enzyme (YggS family)
MSVKDGLQRVRERINDAAARGGRPPGSVRLVGVSKGNPPELVAEAVAAGLRDIGENRVQEAVTKIPAVASLVDHRLSWHLVGHLQTNKTRQALDLFDTIQSVDSLRVAQALSRRADRPLPVFLEVQFAHTPDRFGFEPDAIEDAYNAISVLPHIDIRGLMTVAPLGLEPAGIRGVFRRLRERRDTLQERREIDGIELSMGMTDDYEIAVEEGATLVRIGRAIFAA